MATNKTAPVRLETPPFIVMFPNAFKARVSDLAEEGAAAKYGLTAVFDSSKWTAAQREKFKAILAAMDAESMSAFKKPWASLKSDKKGLRRNAERDTEFDFVDSKTYFANLTSTKKPGVCDVNGDDIDATNGNEDLLYQGCIAKATVRVFSYDKKGSKGVALGLFNIKVLVSDPKKAPRRDNSKTAAEEFSEDDESEFLKGFEGDEEEVPDDESY